MRQALIIAPHAVPHTEVNTTSKRILLVEDNELNIQAIGDYLEHKGYHVDIARNGREALDRASAARPDIILMDIQMPEMDGLEAIRLLRAREEFTATPIIALTALAMPGDRERCLAAGANEYMTKPISLRGLVEAIQTLQKL
jgi:CheY-like chemotaxis protein